MRLNSPTWWSVRLDATRYYLASIFDTLLSSQGSDAHQRLAQRARRRGWYPCCPPCGEATVLTYPRPCLGVKSVIRSGERPDRIALGSLRGAHSSTLRRRLQLGVSRPPRWSGVPVWEWDQLAGPACLGLGGDPSAWRPFLPLGLTSRTLDDVPRRTQIGSPAGASRQRRYSETPCQTAGFVSIARSDCEAGALSRHPRGARRPAPCAHDGARPPARAARRRPRAPGPGRSPSPR